MQLPYLVDWSPRQRRQKLAWWILAPRWLPQVEGLRCSVAVISLGEDTKVIEPVGLAEIQEGDNGAKN